MTLNRFFPIFLELDSPTLLEGLVDANDEWQFFKTRGRKVVKRKACPFIRGL